MKYQLTKQNWLVYGLGTVLCCYSTGLEFKISLRARKVSGPFEKRAPDFTPVDRKIQNGSHKKQILSIDKVISLHLIIINLVCESPLA